MKYDSFDWKYVPARCDKPFFIDLSFPRHTLIKLMCSWWKNYVIIGLIEVRYKELMYGRPVECNAFIV